MLRATGPSLAVVLVVAACTELTTPEDPHFEATPLDFSPLLINDRGWILGWTEAGCIIWMDGDVRALPPVMVPPDWHLEDMNDEGQVVGWHEPENVACDSITGECLFSQWAFTWDGELTQLGPGQANAINEAGDVVGSSPTLDWPGEATLWRDGTAIGLGVRGVATAINDRGQIAGSDADGRAFLWEEGRLRDLGAGYPIALNDSGVVLIQGGIGGWLAWFLWEPRGTRNLSNEWAELLQSEPDIAQRPWWAVDLNDAGWVLVHGSSEPSFVHRDGELIFIDGPALGINNRGDVIGGQRTTARNVVWRFVP